MKKTKILTLLCFSFFLFSKSIESKEQFWILIRSAISPDYIANGDYKYGVTTSQITKDIFNKKESCLKKLKKDFIKDKNQEASRILQEKFKKSKPFYIISFMTISMVVKAECGKVTLRD
tara:strand:- start:241 stop:597 length:357 start_codon:yes stop_codon:yes gene_type:complete